VGVQVIIFIIGAAGAAVLLDYSTYDSQIQPLIRARMRYLISESHNEHAASVLRMIQETVSAYPTLVHFATEWEYCRCCFYRSLMSLAVRRM
jgi:hypothetical protein